MPLQDASDISSPEHTGLMSELWARTIPESKESDLGAAAYLQAVDLKVYKSCWSSGSDSQLAIRQSDTAAGPDAEPSLIVSGFKHGLVFDSPPSTYCSLLGFWQRLPALTDMDLRCPRM